MKQLNIKCKGHTTAKLNELLDFQGNLKKLNPENLNKFKNQLLELGFSEPCSVWINKDKKYLLNGHQRVIALKALEADGYFIPEIPINIVEAENRKEAKKKLLALTSQYGEFDNINDFMIDAELQLNDLENFTIDLGFDNILEENTDDDKTSSSIKEAKIMIICPPRTWVTSKENIIKDLEPILENYGMILKC